MYDSTGFLGSNIAEAFLSAGYRVRGTARSVSKLANLKARWENQFGAERFEMAVVEDMAIEGAFDQAMKGEVSDHMCRAILITFDYLWHRCMGCCTRCICSSYGHFTSHSH